MSNRPAILDRVEGMGYAVFTGPWNVNIIGVRHLSRIANVFDDRLHLVYQDDEHKWVEKIYTITTDPGTYWLQNPSNVDGTAMLVPNQYRGAYRLGLHRGRYEALVQAKEVAVYRDNDGDNVLDPTKGPFWGFFGINIHKAGRASTRVDKWSAGCQVFAIEADYHEFMSIVKKSMERYGPHVTYTLIGD